MGIKQSTLENLAMISRRPSKDFWCEKRVLVTGHTGFKGMWLSLCLHRLGAKVSGISLAPDSSPNLYNLIDFQNIGESILCDIRDLKKLSDQFQTVDPEFVFHMAAQPLVRKSYLHPVDTFSSNITGTVHVLECMRTLLSLKAAVMITTDKVYKDHKIKKPYIESAPLGGNDPYSSSKAACEIVINSYRKSYFEELCIPVASARAGNVIGGGDWSEDRLIPDAIRAWEKQETLRIRRPNATRPWQHVLEPLHGYLMLAQQISSDQEKAQAYNFGPDIDATASVREVITIANNFFGEGEVEFDDSIEGPHESDWLSLDTSKSQKELGFIPQWSLSETIQHSISWYKDLQKGEDALTLCNQQIALYNKT